MTTSLFRNWVYLINILAVGIALVLGYLSNNVSRFFGERHFTTWLSGAQLFAIAFLAWRIWRQRGGETNGFWTRKSLIWLIMALGFLYLTFDELLQFHENLDKGIHHLFGWKESALSDRLDDLIVGAYAIIGAAAIYFYRSEFTTFRSHFAYFKAGFALLFTMVVLDMLSNRPDVFAENIQNWVGAAEDSAKLFAEATFLVGYHSIRAKLHDGR